MDSLRQLCARLAGLFRRRNLETEMAEEMRQHLERRTQEKIADGIAPDEARDAARREFGDLERVQEQCRAEHRLVRSNPILTLAQCLNIMTPSIRPAPICGVLSVTLTPLALLFAFAASLLLEAFLGRVPHGLARAVVLYSMLIILAGALMGVAGLLRSERHRWLSGFGWVSTLCIVGSFIHFDKDG